MAGTSTSLKPRDAVIVAYVRTPIGRHAGALAKLRPDSMAGQAIAALVERTGIEPAGVDDVILGCANQAGEDNRNVARMAALLAGFPVDVPGQTVNRLCGSGLQAVNAAAQAIHGYLSRDGVSPIELLRIGREELGPYAVELRHVTVIDVVPGGEIFEVHLDTGERLVTRTVLVATVVRDDVPEIDGVRSYPSVMSIEGAVDLAIIVVPRDAVEGVIDDCVAKPVGALVVISAGFGETGAEGRALEQRLLEKVRAAGIRMVGPNCMGVINADPQVSLDAPAP